MIIHMTPEKDTYNSQKVTAVRYDLNYVVRPNHGFQIVSFPLFHIFRTPSENYIEVRANYRQYWPCRIN